MYTEGGGCLGSDRSVLCIQRGGVVWVQTTEDNHEIQLKILAQCYQIGLDRSKCAETYIFTKTNDAYSLML